MKLTDLPAGAGEKLWVPTAALWSCGTTRSGDQARKTGDPEIEIRDSSYRLEWYDTSLGRNLEVELQ